MFLLFICIYKQTSITRGVYFAILPPLSLPPCTLALLLGGKWLDKLGKNFKIKKIRQGKILKNFRKVKKMKRKGRSKSKKED